MLISDERQLDMLPDLPWAPDLGADQRRASRWSPGRSSELEPDVVFSPMQTIGSWGRRYGLVLTLHDLIYYATARRRAIWPGRSGCSGGSTTWPGGRSGCC